jgi:hypothetical protein
VRSPKGYFHSFRQAGGVFLATAEGSDESQMCERENARRKMRHFAVLRKLTSIGASDASAHFSRDINLDLKSKNRDNLRTVVLQEVEVGRVLGAGLAATFELTR